jgi:hypothetical protein
MGVTRDTLKLQEEPAMGKKVSKSEKLDLILSELVKLRGEVKKLVRDRAVVAHQGVKAVKKLVRDRAAVAQQDVKAQPKSKSGRPEKPPNPTAEGKKPNKDMAPSRPLAQAAQMPSQPTSRTGSP